MKRLRKMTCIITANHFAFMRFNPAAIYAQVWLSVCADVLAKELGRWQ